MSRLSQSTVICGVIVLCQTDKASVGNWDSIAGTTLDIVERLLLEGD